MERRTYTVPEAARILGCGRTHLYDLIARNDLPGVIRLGQKIVISRQVIDQMVAPPVDEPEPASAAS